MPTNAKMFNSEILRWVNEEVPRALADLTVAIAIDLRATAAKYTPKDTGYHATRWQIATGTVPQTPAPAPTAALGGTAVGILGLTTGPQARGAGGRFRRAPKGEDMFVFNDARAIRILDEGGFVPPDPGPSRDPRPHRRGRILVAGGYSTQAPNGIVDKAVAETRLRFSAPRP